MQRLFSRSLYHCCFLAAAVLFFSFRPASADSENITLVAADGYRIAALLTVPVSKPLPAAGVVLLHMYRHTKESWRPLVNELAARGITSLAIDLRGHGASLTAPDGSDGSNKVVNRDPEFFNTMYLDAAAALHYLTEKLQIPPEKTALVGASVGCSIAIRTALEYPMAAVVVMTPGRDYLEIPTMKHIDKWPGIPLLILASEEEAGRGAVDIHAALQYRGAELILFDEEGIHGTNMFGAVQGVEKMIADWLTAVLKEQ